MTIKAKWNNIHFEGSNTRVWVFAEGKMYVISEAAHAQDKQDKLKKTSYGIKPAEKEKWNIK